MSASNGAHSPETSEYSQASWKRVPTTTDVLFGLALPYRAPESSLGAFLWRKRLWFETTFALSMLQPWEKMMLVIFMASFFVCFATGICLYFPNHLSFVMGRTKYYLLGQENPDATVAESITRLVTGWGWNATSSRLTSL